MNSCQSKFNTDRNGPIVVETRSLNQAKLNAIDLALSVCPLNIAIDGGALERWKALMTNFTHLKI